MPIDDMGKQCRYRIVNSSSGAVLTIVKKDQRPDGPVPVLAEVYMSP